jgi:lysophospholipid acyltransferase (LPLAT)-like uncharacterized protein
MDVASSSRSGVVKPRPSRWHDRPTAALIYAGILGLGATVRFRLSDSAAWLHTSGPEPVIFCIWHNRLALSLTIYNRFLRRRQPDRKMAAMVSASQDGNLLSCVLERLRVQPVRGSTSRRGPQAMRELTGWAKKGYDLAITPDGPRGPRYVIQEGIIALAQLTGFSIRPVSYHLSHKTVANSWDRFQLPWPFSCCEVSGGELIRVPRETSESDREKLRQQLEASMRQITRD